MPLIIRDLVTGESTYVDENMDPQKPLLDGQFNLMLAIAEMAEADEISRLNMQLAIAELAEIIAGGVSNG